VKQLNEVKSPWKDHPGRRAARVTEILNGQLPRTAQSLRKSRKVMVNTTAVNMGISLHTLQQTATQLKIGQSHKSRPKGRETQFFHQYLCKEIKLLAKTSSKKKILEMYASVIKREQAKLDGSKKPEKRRKMVASEIESEDEMSVQVICAPI
jgi:hypothetical protein